MAKKPTKKSAPKKVAVKKSAKKAAKKASKKKTSKKSELIISFKEEKDGMGVQITGNHVSPQMMAMAHEALGEAIMQEMTGIKRS